jgi:hypothetical protein
MEGINMSKNTKTSSPSPEMVVETVADNSEQAANVLSIAASKSRRAGPLDRIDVLMTEAARIKNTNLQAARQKLAEAADYAKEGEARAKEAAETAGQGAFLLFEARRAGAIDDGEVTGVLGDTFGFKPKKDGTDGRTPAGMGEQVRKRVVRAVNAWNYVNNNVSDKFFDGLPKDDVAAIINSMEPERNKDGEIVKNGTSPFTAFDLLTKLRQKNVSRTPAWFDANHIGKLVDGLAAPEAIDNIEGNDVLLAQYAALRRMIEHINSELALRESEAA